MKLSSRVRMFLLRAFLSPSRFLSRKCSRFVLTFAFFTRIRIKMTSSRNSMTMTALLRRLPSMMSRPRTRPTIPTAIWVTQDSVPKETKMTISVSLTAKRRSHLTMTSISAAMTATAIFSTALISAIPLTRTDIPFATDKFAVRSLKTARRVTQYVLFVQEVAWNLQLLIQLK